MRVNGNPTDVDLEPLRKGITVDGERFQPMQVTLDRIQGANAWLTVGLREGKNREIRRAMNAIDLYVNRLIRTSYGPFRLNDLQPGEVEEVRQKTLREQLGEATEPPCAPPNPLHARRPPSLPRSRPQNPLRPAPLPNLRQNPPRAARARAQRTRSPCPAPPAPAMASRPLPPPGKRPSPPTPAQARPQQDPSKTPSKTPAQPTSKPAKPAAKGSATTRTGTARPPRAAPAPPPAPEPARAARNNPAHFPPSPLASPCRVG